MKNRKSIIALILVVMVLVLGVGYAVVSTTSLNINGSATAKDRQLDVVISAANPTSGTAYGTVSNPVDKNATITVTDLDTTTNTATVTYTITNRESDVAAKVYVGNSGISNSNSTYFGVSTSIDGVGNAVTIQPGTSATMTVTVNLLAMPYENGTNTTTIGVTITADPVARS